MGTALLLTGEPKIGKSTAISKIVAAIGMDRCGGFFTEEVIADGSRTGFQIVTLSGKKTMIASVDSDSAIRVGKYGVNLSGLESTAVEEIQRALENKDIVVVDEIGPMQLFSEVFKDTIIEILESNKLLLGTIVYRPYPWADELKTRDDVELLRLTVENRNDLVDEVVARLMIELSNS